MYGTPRDVFVPSEAVIEGFFGGPPSFPVERGLNYWPREDLVLGAKFYFASQRLIGMSVSNDE